jgi:hypothetical protein
MPTYEKGSVLALTPPEDEFDSFWLCHVESTVTAELSDPNMEDIDVPITFLEKEKKVVEGDDYERGDYSTTPFDSVISVVRKSGAELGATFKLSAKERSAIEAQQEKYAQERAAAGPAATADVEVRDGKMLIGTPATAVTVLNMEKHGVDVDEIGSKAEFPANGKFTSPHQFFKYVGELVEDVGGGAIHSKEPLDESSPLFLAARKLNQKIDATYTTQYEYFKLMESKLGQGWKVRLEWDDPVALLKSTPEQLVSKTVGAGLGPIVDVYYRAPTSYHIHENIQHLYFYNNHATES